MKHVVYPKEKIADWTTQELEKDLEENGFTFKAQISSRIDSAGKFVIYEQKEAKDSLCRRV